MSYRLGVFGGMFDPVHRGHVEAARHAVELLKLDKLKLVPCNTPNHRDYAIASGEHRLKMLSLAIAGESKLETDSIELRREGVSYMVDTLAEIRISHKSAELVLILGMDAFNGLPDWHRFEDIRNLCHVLVLARTGEDTNPDSRKILDRHWHEVEAAEQLFAVPTGYYFIENDFHYDASSTAARQAVENHSDSHPLLHREVAAFIKQHKLYSTT